MPVATSAAPCDQASTSAGLASMREVGLEIGNTIGRSAAAAIASITSRVNAPCAVEVPSRMVPRGQKPYPDWRWAKSAPRECRVRAVSPRASSFVQGPVPSTGFTTVRSNSIGTACGDDLIGTIVAKHALYVFTANAYPSIPVGFNGPNCG